MKQIHISGARTHNLKNITLSIPHNQLVVITGLSGSGKSSLAFNTVYAEGQRRYVESLSAYARQFLSVMEKPEVDFIEGLSPTIAIEQKTASHNPRSTVGTVTEIYDYFRLLFARVGQPRCPEHGLSLEAQTVSQMVDTLLALPIDSRIMILAPLIRERKGEYTKLIDHLLHQGFVRVRLNGEMMELDQLPPLELQKKHRLDVVIDRIKIRPENALRISESLETALRLTGGIASAAGIGKEDYPDFIFSSRYACSECGYSLPELEPRLFSFNNPIGACPSCNGLGVQDVYFSTVPCKDCGGARLRKEARHVFIQDYSLPALMALSIREIAGFVKNLTLSGHRQEIAARIIKEIQDRLNFLLNVGLDYLTLDRKTSTLSGGEAQRIRLASQIGSGLVGVTYILDEPSIGLHQCDNERLLQTLLHLRDLGNTVLVIEHDEEAIRTADHIIDLGPYAGVEGGQVVAEGPLKSILENPASLTGRYLARTLTIEVPTRRVTASAKRLISLKGAKRNNLKSIDVDIPVGLMTCVTGVSGSGKSSLVNDTLYPAIVQRLKGGEETGISIQEWEIQQKKVDSCESRDLIEIQRDSCLCGNVSSKSDGYDSISGLDYLDKAICIDQSPIGRTPRSNPATYTDCFSLIRELLAATPEARSRGYRPGRFSFNVKGGRCEACQGAGLIKVEMHFLADMYVTCEVCQGKRYNRETLEIRYKGKNVNDILNMTVSEARSFFDAIPQLTQKFQTLVDVGLSYIRLGQGATILSGGEAQRVKLSKELSRRDTGRTLYILDEPTTGLHFHDVKQLLHVLHALRDRGNTIVVIEHNLDVIKTADWIIDLGPEGGDRGGKIVATGTPETVAACKHSKTGKFLKRVLL